ncbi:methylated-DNA--[protein]-cysteine S-methyltransferase [Amycolatopsis sp. WGS_07]|uniref:methylated-DNA--[protein]-cysteine S-methyltransferase n=1 Tax=Amycolatopsis sp. WGS_07 TaxID=3076764 RepID=UPI00387338BC
MAPITEDRWLSGTPSPPRRSATSPWSPTAARWSPSTSTATAGPRASRTSGPRTDDGFADATRQLDEYFTGQRQTFDLELDLRGSEFERRVWQLLTRIPYGETRTYRDLAVELGEPGAAQAVGNANGWNPLSIVVPCHRVVGSSGGLTGYAGGVDRKRFLLQLEEPPAHDAGRLF